MCAECTFIEEDRNDSDTPMIFDDTPENEETKVFPNLLSGNSCCGGNCCNGG